MAVARVGTTVGPYWSGNSGSLSWPAGTAVGHLAVLRIYGTPSSTRQVDGWQTFKHTPSSDHFWKVLTAADIASALPIVKGYAASVSVYSGAGRIGAVSDLASQSPGVTTTVAGSMVDISGRGRSTLTPSGALGSDQVIAAYSNRHCNTWSLGPQATPGWAGLSGFNGSDSTSVEIVPIAGPSAPTITGPLSASSVSAAGALVVSWIHRSAQTGTQDGYSVRLVKDGTTTYYLTSGGTLTGSVTTIASSSASASIASGQLVSGSSYVVSVQTSEGGVWSAWSSVTVAAITPPSVSSVSVASPAGSLTPVVSWTGSTTGGQQAFHVRILPATAASADDVSVLWDSQATAGTDSSASAPPLATWVNGQSLKAWVRIQQPGLWSAWVASSAFSVSWTAPAAPSSVVAANQPAGPLRVTVAGVVAPATTVPLTNSVTNGAFVNGTAGWVAGSGSISAVAGALSVAAAGGTGRASQLTGLIATSSHKLYLAFDFKPVDACTRVTTYVLKTNQDGAKIGNVTANNPTTGAWVRLSGVLTTAADYAELGQSMTVLIEAVSTSWQTDNVVLIDLTEAYGAGNEPTKAAMDATLTTWAGSWFDGVYDPATSHEVQVQASTDAGVTWADVASKAPAASTVVVDVPGVRYAVPALYRARVRSPYLGAPLWSGWTTSAAAVASTDMAGYLVGDDGSYRAVRIRTDEPPEREEPFTDFYGLSAITARVDSGPAQGWSGATTILTETLAEREELIAWLDAHPVWVWRWPPERHGAAYADAGSIRVTRHASFKPARLAQVAISERDIPIGWVEQ